MWRSRSFRAGFAAAAFAAAAGALLPVRADAARIAVSCGALGVELKLCREATAEWERRTGHSVEIVSTPNSSTERFALYVQMLAARARDVDVFQIDVVWAGQLADYFVDLAPHVGDAPGRHFPALIENATVEGRLVAMPWWTDAGVLFYRADLLEKHGHAPPRTWADLERIAADVQAQERAAGHDGLWGYVWQGRPYEGLTCNALEWLDAHDGAIVDDAGEVVVDTPGNAAALELAAGWVGTISPPGVVSYDEEAARGVFQTGNAVFMRNWPYAWALAQGEDSPVRGRVGVVPLPRGDVAGGRTTGVLGGWNLAVSRYSRHPEIAADLVRFLTSAEQQKARAIEASYNPTIPALYEDPDVLAANAFFGELRETFAGAVARPARALGPQYGRVSSLFWRAAHDVLTGQAEAAPRLAALAEDIERAGRRARRTRD